MWKCVNRSTFIESFKSTRWKKFYNVWMNKNFWICIPLWWWQSFLFQRIHTKFTTSMFQFGSLWILLGLVSQTIMLRMRGGKSCHTTKEVSVHWLLHKSVVIGNDSWIIRIYNYELRNNSLFFLFFCLLLCSNSGFSFFRCLPRPSSLFSKLFLFFFC